MSFAGTAGLTGMKLSLTTFLTLDGVYQGPGGPTEDTSGGFTQGGWLMPLFDKDLGDFMTDVFVPAEGFVLGRKTYDIFAASWPQMNDPDDPIGSKLNSLPKFVASTTLTAARWNNSTILSGDVVAEVAKLKERPGGELQIHGSGNLAQTLFDANLIDIFHFVVAPVVLGSGKRLFPQGRTPSGFRLTGLRSTGSGVTLQTFESAGAPAYATFQAP
jgi:dihydrofolate reductase